MLTDPVLSVDLCTSALGVGIQAVPPVERAPVPNGRISTDRALLNVLSVLGVGGFLSMLVPGYVRRNVGHVQQSWIGCLLWGVLAIVGTIVAAVILFFSLVGFPLVTPLLFSLLAASVIGNAIGYIALVGRYVDGLAVPLLLGAGAAGLLGLVPYLGVILAYSVATLGLGAIVYDWRLG